MQSLIIQHPSPASVSHLKTAQGQSRKPTRVQPVPIIFPVFSHHSQRGISNFGNTPTLICSEGIPQNTHLGKDV